MSDAADIVVAIPVLGRPERVEGLLWSLDNGQTGSDVRYRALFLVSPNDSAEARELRERGAEHLVVPWPPGPGDWAKKINHAFRETEEPFLLCGADDLCFCPQWADRALECAAATGAGVVGTNDLSSPRVVRGDHSCHPLVRRSYIDERGTIDGPGTVVSEAYDHCFVDDELVATARSRNEWHFCEQSWVEHLHPDWGKGKTDATYRKGQARFNDDRRLFLRRRALWA